MGRASVIFSTMTSNLLVSIPVFRRRELPTRPAAGYHPSGLRSGRLCALEAGAVGAYIHNQPFHESANYTFLLHAHFVL